MHIRPASDGGSSPGRRGTALHDRFVLAVAAFFACGHLASLPRHLEDIDSLNFALGLREYDVAAHQPHPPGYPVFTVLARASARLMSPLAGDLATRDALGMAVLAGLAGAVALLLLHRILQAIAPTTGADGQAPPLVTALTATTPLFWLTGSRPLSDMPGLAAALACQLLLLRAGREAAPRRDALLAALACGVATGVRSQVTWLVVPLLIWLVLRVWRRVDPRAALAVTAAALAGVLTWAIPMVVLTGGPEAYRAALTSQAGEDFEGVPMLVLQPGLRRLALALSDTFIAPWGWWPLAAMMLAVAAAGIVALRRRGPFVQWLALGYGPYAAYHLLFQETETTRYALPLAPVVATLVVVALLRWAPRRARLLAVVFASIALGVSLHAHRQYVRTGATIGEALRRMDAAAREATARPQVVMHRRVWAETRRARSVITPAPSFDVLPARRAREWQGATTVWQQGDTPVWWLVDPRRGDRAAIDPRGLRWREHVGWPAPVSALLGGMRPHPFDWYDATTPQWVLLDGWGLTPELAGLSAAANQGPSQAGATALVRGQAGASTLMIGGRYLPGAHDQSARSLSVRLADHDLPSVTLPRGHFAFTWVIPAGTIPAAGYSRLQVHARTATADTEERVFLEQFDLQPVGVPVVALEAGWYEPERDTGTGRQWRWVADGSGLRIAGAGSDVTLAIAGTYPRHYDREPVLEIFAGGRRVAAHTLRRPFQIEQRVTAQQLGEDGRVTWRVSPSFVAGERTGTADARRLALEISSLRVVAVR